MVPGSQSPGKAPPFWWFIAQKGSSFLKKGTGGLVVELAQEPLEFLFWLLHIRLRGQKSELPNQALQTMLPQQ